MLGKLQACDSVAGTGTKAEDSRFANATTGNDKKVAASAGW